MPRREITTRFVFEERNAGIINQLNRGIEQFTAFAFSPAGAVAAVTAIGAGVAALTSQYLDNAKAINRVSESTGVGVESISALQFAFQRLGYDMTDVDAILRELDIKTYDWQEGNLGVANAFRELNLELDSFQDLSPDEKLRQVASALNEIEGNRRGGIADAIFGGDDAAKVLAIAESLEDLTDLAVQSGNTIDQASAESAAKFQRNIDTIQAIATGAGNRIGMAIVNWSGPILQGAGEAFGLLPKEAQTQAELTEQAFTNRLTEALLAGETLGDALTDPVIRRLQSMAQSAGVNVRLAIASVERELRQQDLDNALVGFEGALYQGLTPQRSAELQAQNFPNLSVGDILSESARRNPAFNAGGQTGAPEDLNLALQQALLLGGNPALNAGGSTNVPIDFRPIEPELQRLIDEIRRLHESPELQWPSSFTGGLVQDILFDPGDRTRSAQHQLNYLIDYWSRFQNFSGGGLTGFDDPYAVGGGIPSRFRNAAPLNFRPVGAPEDIGLIPGYTPDNPVSVSINDGHPLNVRIVEEEEPAIDPFLLALNTGAGAPQGGVNIEEVLEALGIGEESRGGGGRGGGLVSAGDPLGLIEASKNDPLRVSLAGLGGLNEDAEARQQRELRPINVDGNELIAPDRLRNFILSVIDDYIN